MSYNAQFVSALKEALNGLRTIHAVGEEWCSYIGQIPTGGVPYCGQEVTRSTYSALWSYAQSQGLVKSESEWQSIANAQGGNVPFYSSGDGSSTFRMPRLVGYVRGASGQSEAGAYVKEGLPNISGSVGTNDSVDPLYSGLAGYRLSLNKEQSGAIDWTVNGGGISLGAGTTNTAYVSVKTLTIDASRSNPIYGNSSHVTPETSVVLFGVYAFGEVGNVDVLDAGTLASALAKAESNIAALQSKPSPYAYVAEVWSSGANWYRKYSDGWIEQGGLSSTPSGDNWVKVTFPVAFSNKNYTVLVTNQGPKGNLWSDASGNISNEGKANESFEVFLYNTRPCSWVACGY